MAEIAAAARPAIVNIASTDVTKIRQTQDHFFKKEYGQSEKPKEQNRQADIQEILNYREAYTLQKKNCYRNHFH
jgi:hypothetical protein